MKILFGILAIIVLVLLISAFLPKEFNLSSEVTINKPVTQVRDYVKLFSNQTQYSVRVMADPNVVLTYTGTQGEVGASQSWDSPMRNVGAGTQTITAIDPGKSMDVKIDFLRPMQATNFAKTTLKPTGNGGTKVTTTFYGKNPWPGNLISYFFLPQVQKDMDANNANLKKVLEK